MPSEHWGCPCCSGLDLWPSPGRILPMVAPSAGCAAHGGVVASTPQEGSPCVRQDLEQALRPSPVWGVAERRDLVHPTAEHGSRPGSDWKVKVRMCPKGSRNLSTWC